MHTHMLLSNQFDKLLLKTLLSVMGKHETSIITHLEWLEIYHRDRLVSAAAAKIYNGLVACLESFL